MSKTILKCEKQYQKVQKEADRIAGEKRKQRIKEQVGTTKNYLKTLEDLEYPSS